MVLYKLSTVLLFITPLSFHAQAGYLAAEAESGTPEPSH